VSANSNRRTRRTFQRFEVVCGGETLRIFSKRTSLATIKSYAAEASLTRTRAVAIDAVSKNGSNGQHTSSLGAFVAGTWIGSDR